MLKNKKSSLSLSINAIVILILAITMLGLGLTFMRGLFTQATSKIEAAVSAQELANPPTVDNPVTLYPSTLTLRKNEQGKILLAFMHTEGSDRDCTLGIVDKDDDAVSPGSADYGNYMIYNGGAVTMPADKIYTWAITIDPDDSVAAADCGELEVDRGATYETPPPGDELCPDATFDTVGPHIYTAKMTCASGGAYKKDILIKITS